MTETIEAEEEESIIAGGRREERINRREKGKATREATRLVACDWSSVRDASWTSLRDGVGRIHSL